MLSQNDKKFYLENGYLILNDKLDKQTIINLQNATQQMINEFKTISDKELPEFKSKLLLATDLIGICQEDYLDWFDDGKVDIDTSKVDALILERLNAKKNKDFDKADAIRQQLLEMSIEIKDTESGTDWTVKV